MSGVRGRQDPQPHQAMSGVRFLANTPGFLRYDPLLFGPTGHESALVGNRTLENETAGQAEI